jgi:hypothetical protein
MTQLDKRLADAELQRVKLQKVADILAARLADIDRRLTKLESREHWPAFYEAVSLAPGTVIARPPRKLLPLIPKTETPAPCGMPVSCLLTLNSSNQRALVLLSRAPSAK